MPRMPIQTSCWVRTVVLAELRILFRTLWCVCGKTMDLNALNSLKSPSGNELCGAFLRLIALILWMEWPSRIFYFKIISSTPNPPKRLFSHWSPLKNLCHLPRISSGEILLVLLYKALLKQFRIHSTRYCQFSMPLNAPTPLLLWVVCPAS